MPVSGHNKKQNLISKGQGSGYLGPLGLFHAAFKKNIILPACTHLLIKEMNFQESKSYILLWPEKNNISELIGEQQHRLLQTLANIISAPG